MEPKITHVLFDFFGTLVEYNPSRTEQGYELSYALLKSASANLPYTDFLNRWNTVWEEFEQVAETTHDEYSMNDVVRTFLHDIFNAKPPQEIFQSFRDVYLSEWGKGVKEIDGVASMLHQLGQHCTLAVVTNTHNAAFVQTRLSQLGLDRYFSRVVTSVEHGKRKPHPSIFEFALKMTGGAPERSVYVGDSFRADYLGARGAGMSCFLIDPNQTADISPAHRIAHILEVRSAIESIGSSG